MAMALGPQAACAAGLVHLATEFVRGRRLWAEREESLVGALREALKLLRFVFFGLSNKLGRHFARASQSCGEQFGPRRTSQL